MELLDKVPWSDRLTNNDHFTIYLHLLDACADNASEEEMAQAILGIDPVREPTRALTKGGAKPSGPNTLAASGYKGRLNSQA